MKIELKYSLVFALVGLGLIMILVFLSQIFLILGVTAICFLIGFIIDYSNAKKSGRKVARRRKRR